MDAKTQMHFLLEIGAFAALVKAMLPTWVSPSTPRQNTGRACEFWKVPEVQEYFVQEQPWYITGQDPPASEEFRLVTVSLKTVRVRSESVSLMNFDFGIGFEARVGRNGVVLYWIDDPLPDEVYEGGLWVDTPTYYGLSNA